MKEICQIDEPIRQLSYGIHRTPFGALGIAVCERGICSAEFVDDDAEIEAWLDRVAKNWPEVEGRAQPTTGLESLRTWIDRGEAVLPLAVRATELQIAVWEHLRAIPRGETASYRELAEKTGKPVQAARAIGNCVAANQHALFIPCHRAIRQDGALGGFRWGTDRKRRILLWEKTGV